MVSIDEDDKQWLDRKAAREGVSMTEVIRRAVRRLRSEEAQAQDFARLLHATSGISQGEDGLAVQRRLRNEWRRRSA
ncbi:MAG: ribbon-helix-helix protein, CopG family [Acidobacteria bacterium]|nr:ribbon-helix-helix protein, CopG family [Acidobacteriota bacterium]